ncbi:dATP/dGTP diphosphohydrolase domain-containing protein [Microvirga lotononidis]|uniref:dATP/dGTP diphosphohydrolase N-terminal domain-containing protein n=2 Tax=Microvirga lotononidis TaxID=864069 RepID=I4YP78_9HYPH|nr:dATP/dGTP diphosphohydrolase domain-containing protein [Microvirga lotononidis]EIM25770.1 hypothetical protein MicloDRAFT_00064970 [Microvirga lotononidis]WQO25696.1 dATP/dGTP diphosphohydrolase domain-containing protein [Microvirga lotononidis]
MQVGRMQVAAFKKDDAGKPRWSLLPWDVLLGVVHILGFGADKYGPDNWCAGADWSRYYNSTQRHLIAFWMGERADPESGRSHLLHAICGLLFLAAYEIRGIGKDDRPSLSADPSPSTASDKS